MKFSNLNKTIEIKIKLLVVLVGIIAILLFFLFQKPDLTANDEARKEKKAELELLVKENEALRLGIKEEYRINELLKSQIKDYLFYKNKSKKVFDETIGNFRNANDSVRFVRSTTTIYEFEFN